MTSCSYGDGVYSSSLYVNPSHCSIGSPTVAFLSILYPIETLNNENCVFADSNLRRQFAKNVSILWTVILLYKPPEYYCMVGYLCTISNKAYAYPFITPSSTSNLNFYKIILRYILTFTLYVTYTNYRLLSGSQRHGILDLFISDIIWTKWALPLLTLGVCMQNSWYQKTEVRTLSRWSIPGICSSVLPLHIHSSLTKCRKDKVKSIYLESLFKSGYNMGSSETKHKIRSLNSQENN